jgi:hypothetical protein
MGSVALTRVFCVDGPCHGEQYMNLDTGRILLDGNTPAPHHIYRLDADERIGIRDLPTAYYIRTE